MPILDHTPIALLKATKQGDTFEVCETQTLGNLSTRCSWYHDANRKYFCSMTATVHVKTFLSHGHRLQNTSSQVETRGSYSGFFEEYSSYKSRNSSSEIMFSSQERNKTFTQN